MCIRDSRCLYEIELGIVERDALAVIIRIFGIHTEGDVTSLVAQLAVDLQHTVDIVITRIGDSVSQLTVHHSLSLIPVSYTHLREIKIAIPLRYLT